MMLPASHKPGDKRLVICGSMSFYREMEHLQRELVTKGVYTLIPEPDDHPEAISIAAKNLATKAHFSKILDPSTWGILIVNLPKRGVRGYIGPNTFAEAALAFYFSKSVLLLYPPPKELQDELHAWGAISVDGSAEKIGKFIGKLMVDE